MGNAAVRFEKVFWDTGKWTEKQQENGLRSNIYIYIYIYIYFLSPWQIAYLS